MHGRMDLTVRYRCWLLLAATLVLIAGGGQASGQGADDYAVCRDAGMEAERTLGLPPGLLLAIGRVESGRRDPATGRVAAWPWTLNAGGAGQMFGSAAEAQAVVRSRQAGGVASVDVGCFQVSLLHHPAAFASLEEAFDPKANAAYAGRFLSSLRARMGSWDAAVAAYHSATPERGGPYRDRVMASWTGAGALPPAEPPAVVVRPLAERVLVWVAPPATDGIRVWTPSRPGMAPASIVISTAPAVLRSAAR